MKYLTLLFLPLLFMACNSEDHYIPNPVDVMIKSMKQEKTYSIILDDMDVRDDGYFHKYGVIKESQMGELKSAETDWEKVDEQFFRENERNLGMEIASKDSLGVVSKAIAPAGYSNYIGNDRYGQWQGSENNSFWVFYGQYAFMRSMFGLGYHPAYYHMHTSYYTGYRGTGRAYYGSGAGGANYYGTNSVGTKQGKPNFFSRKARNTNWNKSTSSRYGSSRRSGRGGGFGFGK